MLARDGSNRALQRDLRDAARLAALQLLVGSWLDALAPLAEPLEHPARAWDPGDLVDLLTIVAGDIAAETARLRGPLCIEDEDY